MSSGPNVETIWPSAADEKPASTTVSARHLLSRVEGRLLIIDDGVEVVEISAEIQPLEARERLRQLAVNAIALAETL